MRTMRTLLLVLAAGTTSAIHAADSGFYFGAAAGQASYDFEPLRLRAPLALPSPIPSFPGGSFNPRLPELVPSFPVFGSVTTIAAFAEPIQAFWVPGDDEEATSWNVLAGYRLFRYAAIELAYHDLGTLHEYSPSITIGPVRTVEVRSKMESTAASLSLLGQLPITDRWSAYVRAGGLFADQEVSRRIGSSAFKDSYDSEVFSYGLGTQLDIGAHWTVRLDFQRYDDVGKGNGFGEADVDLLSLGVLFRLTSQ